mmetsp:Transcript_92640/g.261634  ORF Transcript_92640/g.261634 Transcript_92640/m.261634 type:complete len:253 (+) Transcript_92640:432-1190(+)
MIPRHQKPGKMHPAIISQFVIKCWAGVEPFVELRRQVMQSRRHHRVGDHQVGRGLGELRVDAGGQREASVVDGHVHQLERVASDQHVRRAKVHLHGNVRPRVEDVENLHAGWAIMTLRVLSKDAAIGAIGRRRRSNRARACQGESVVSRRGGGKFVGQLGQQRVRVLLRQATDNRECEIDLLDLVAQPTRGDRADAQHAFAHSSNRAPVMAREYAQCPRGKVREDSQRRVAVHEATNAEAHRSTSDPQWQEP